MCPPTYLPALREARSWVPGSDPLDRTRAIEQWQRLRDLVATHIGPVVELQPEPWAPAMAFTRDLACVTDSHVIPLMADSLRGPFEAPLAHRQLTRLGIDLATAPEPVRFDGGNVLPDNHGRLLIGITTALPSAEFSAAVRFLEATTDRAAYAVPLAGGRFPHVDMAVCDLNGLAWLVYPDALPGFDPDDADWKNLFLDRPLVLADGDDGEQLGCNLIVGEGVAIGPEISAHLRREIERHSMAYVATPLTELLKAGGGAHCVTLELPN